MVKWLRILVGALRSAFRPRHELALENLALRQQLAVYKHRYPRPRLDDEGRKEVALVKVAVAPDFGVANVIKSLLENEGIAVFEITTAGPVSIAGADQGYNIEVLQKDEVKTRELLIENSFGSYLIE